MTTRDDLQDALTNPNVRAFLKAIRLGEGTRDDPRTPDVDEGYDEIVGGSRFTDFSKHPQQRVWIERYKVFSSAAGAYQIIWPTWDKLRQQYGFEDFSPACQDEAAVALIIGRKALHNVKNGELAQALSKCADEWASLPGSKAGQRKVTYEAFEAEYLFAGGKLA